MRKLDIKEMQPGMLIRMIIEPPTGSSGIDKYHNTIQRLSKVMIGPGVDNSFIKIHGSSINFNAKRVYSIK